MRGELCPMHSRISCSCHRVHWGLHGGGAPQGPDYAEMGNVQARTMEGLVGSTGLPLTR